MAHKLDIQNVLHNHITAKVSSIHDQLVQARHAPEAGNAGHRGSVTGRIRQRSLRFHRWTPHVTSAAGCSHANSPDSAVKHWQECSDLYDFLEQIGLRPGMCCRAAHSSICSPFSDLEHIP
jgi:hypothetical protein